MAKYVIDCKISKVKRCISCSAAPPIYLSRGKPRSRSTCRRSPWKEWQAWAKLSTSCDVFQPMSGLLCTNYGGTWRKENGELRLHAHSKGPDPWLGVGPICACFMQLTTRFLCLPYPVKWMNLLWVSMVSQTWEEKKESLVNSYKICFETCIVC